MSTSSMEYTSPESVTKLLNDLCNKGKFAFAFMVSQGDGTMAIQGGHADEARSALMASVIENLTKVDACGTNAEQIITDDNLNTINEFIGVITEIINATLLQLAEGNALREEKLALAESRTVTIN
jgi:hypothetical protein